MQAQGERCCLEGEVWLAVGETEEGAPDVALEREEGTSREDIGVGLAQQEEPIDIALWLQNEQNRQREPTAQGGDPVDASLLRKAAQRWADQVKGSLERHLQGKDLGWEEKVRREDESAAGEAQHPWKVRGQRQF